MFRINAKTTTRFLRMTMQSSKTLRLWLAGVLASLVFSSVPGAPADTPASGVAQFPGHLTLHADTLAARVMAVPLKRVMAELSRLSGAQVLWLVRGGEEQVSVDFPALPLAEALARILGEKNFLLFYTTSGEGQRLAQIWISSSPKSEERPPSAHATAPQGKSSTPSDRPPSPSLQDNRRSRRPATGVPNWLARLAPGWRLGSESHLELRGKPSPAPGAYSDGSSRELGASVSPGLVGGVAPSGTQGSKQCKATTSTTHVADVTGDGQADVITVSATQITVRRSDSTRFLAPQAWTSDPYAGTLGTSFADVTGDGQADAITISADQIWVRRASTTGFLPHEAWTTASSYGTKGIVFADVDGDGRADAIALTDMGITVRRSDGTRFLSAEAWTSGPYSGMLGTDFADVDGDGRADAITLHADQITVRRSDGTRFFSPEVWASSPSPGARGTYFADVDGDGRADAIAVTDMEITVRRSDGAQFLAPQVWTSGLYSGTRSMYFADVDGDGRADVIAVHTDQITVQRSTGSRFLPPKAWTSDPYASGLSPLCGD